MKHPTKNWYVVVTRGETETRFGPYYTKQQAENRAGFLTSSFDNLKVSVYRPG